MAQLRTYIFILTPYIQHFKFLTRIALECVFLCVIVNTPELVSICINVWSIEMAFFSTGRLISCHLCRLQSTYSLLSFMFVEVGTVAYMENSHKREQ